MARSADTPDAVLPPLQRPLLEIRQTENVPGRGRGRASTRPEDLPFSAEGKKVRLGFIIILIVTMSSKLRHTTDAHFTYRAGNGARLRS